MHKPTYMVKHDGLILIRLKASVIVSGSNLRREKRFDHNPNKMPPRLSHSPGHSRMQHSADAAQSRVLAMLAMISIVRSECMKLCVLPRYPPAAP